MTDVLAETPVEEIPFEKLVLDASNPRLLKFAKEGPLDDEGMVDAILSRFDPEPVGRSIVEFGFFATEPLIVFLEDQHYVVAEGNRRLAALKLLLDPDLRAAVDAGSTWDKLATELAANPERLERLGSIPCQVVPDRRAAAPIIGYRHIVGILKWDAFEKTAYVVGLLREDPNRSFEDVADLVGERPGRIQRRLRDWLALEQAEAAEINVSAARDEFGRWERAMNAKGVREYIDARSPTVMETGSAAAYDAEDEQMRKLISFLYGEPGGADRIFSDTRLIDDFSVALQSEDGRRVLEEDRDLERAFEAAGGRRSYVLRALARALTALQQAAPDYPDYAADDEIKAAMQGIRDELDGLEKGIHVAAEAAAEGTDDFPLDGSDEDDEFDDELGDDETEDAGKPR